MIRKILPYITVFTLCLTSTACGQEWLEFYPSYDLGLAGMVEWLYMPETNYYYPGPYGVYPFYPSPYCSDFRLNSIAGMNWAPFQKNWSETMNYAQTKSSFKVYPIPIRTSQGIQFPATSYQTTPPPVAATGDSTATIISQRMRGYQVFLDGNYIGTEGTGGDPLDGKFTFRAGGNQNHEVRVYDGRFNYPKTIFFERGGTKIIYVEPGTAVYI